MNIKQALKLKNKLIKSISDNTKLLQEYNTVEVGNERPYSPVLLMGNITKSTYELIELKSKIHRSNAPMFEKIFDIASEQLKKEKFKTNSKLAPALSETRYIPAGLKKAIYDRDKKCQKCGSTYALEVNHIVAYALGGKTELGNLNLLCHNCNQRARLSSNLHLP
jgi:hypothetical protein